MPLTATRLLDAPIIGPHMDDRMGDNICGPAVLRVPDWVAGRLGRYYLYFADHKGSYIRLAYADRLEGPWRMHRPGALDIADSAFDPIDPPEPPEADRPAWARGMKGGYLYAHIASPDVHVDRQRHRILMYYHGLLWNGEQETRLAVSADGISFKPLEPLLGPPYFRAFTLEAFVYVITWGGMLYRAAAWEGPFEAGPQLVPFDAKGGIGEGFRHGEVHRVGDRLHLFYHRMGDRPERILHAEVALKGDWRDWTASDPTTLLQPELPWEGAELALAISTMGAEHEPVRQLRDPCIFADDDGRTYMLYCGGGESGIGLARLDGF